jgi:acyl-coenzyme A synthetase/AMP-(fatty) acid ligase
MTLNNEKYRPIREVIAAQAARIPDKTYVYSIEQDKTLTFGALDRLGNQMAQYFGDRGIKANDRVLMLSENSAEFMAIFLGVQRHGATIATANVEMNRAHIAEIVRAVAPKLVLIQEGLGLEELRDPSDGIEWMLIGAWEEEGGSTGFFGAIEGYSSDLAPKEVCAPEDIAVIFYTSGTEAKPKGVLQPHLSVWANFDGIADCVEMTEDDRLVESRSYTWLSAQNMSLGAPLVAGATVFMAKKFSRSRYFDWVKDYKITIAIAVPTILNILMNEPVDIHGDDLPDLRFLMTSSAPMLPERWHEFEDSYGMHLCQSYGCSEAGLMCSHRGEKRKIGTVGLPLKHQILRLLDPDGNEVPQGEPGEITITGPQLAQGYLQPDGSIQKLPESGHRTGDLGAMDEDGHISIVGRLKDLIIRGGVNISPVEIDNILSRHPETVEGATVGVPDRIYGDEVVAYVVASSMNCRRMTVANSTAMPWRPPGKPAKAPDLTKNYRLSVRRLRVIAVDGLSRRRPVASRRC